MNQTAFTTLGMPSYARRRIKRSAMVDEAYSASIGRSFDFPVQNFGPESSVDPASTLGGLRRGHFLGAVQDTVREVRDDMDQMIRGRSEP